MTRLPLAAGLLVVVSSGALADAPKTYKIPVGTHWQPGQTLTRAARRVDRQEVKGWQSGILGKDDVTERTTAYVRVERCTEVDAGGLWAKGLVYFVEWSMATGAAKDESLKGVTIELAGTAGGHAWRPVSSTSMAPLSADAKAWLDADLGPQSNHEESEAAVAPKKEVAVGESWAPDLPAVVAMMSKRLPLSPERAEGTMTLRSVESDLVTIEMSLKLPTARLPGDRPMAWTNGGTMTMKGVASSRLDGTPGVESNVLDVDLRGQAAEEGTGVTVNLIVTGHKEGSAKPGGEIPAVPATPGK